MRPRQGRDVCSATTPGVLLRVKPPPSHKAMADRMEDRSLRSTQGYLLRTLRGRWTKRSLTRLVRPSLPDPEGIVSHSRRVEDHRDDTTGSLFESCSFSRQSPSPIEGHFSCSPTRPRPPHVVPYIRTARIPVADDVRSRPPSTRARTPPRGQGLLGPSPI